MNRFLKKIPDKKYKTLLWIVVPGLILAFCFAGFAQEKAGFQFDSIRFESKILPYRILFPLNYTPTKKFPLVLFLHGRGEQGTDNRQQLVHGSALFLADSNRSRFPAIVVFPQCPKGDYWSNVIITEDSSGKRHFDFQDGGPPTRSMRAVLALLDTLKKRYRLDTRQLYAGGLSMGGAGTLELIARKPKTFAAAFAICGGAHPRQARKIRKTPLWLFHGEKDDIVDPEFSKILDTEIRKGKGDVRLTLYPNANHNSWDPAFSEPNLLPWLFGHRK